MSIKKIYQDKKITISPREDNEILMICIGISLVFWIVVKLSQSYSTERQILVSYNLPEGKAFIDIPPKQIVATLNGTGWDLFYDYMANASPVIDFNLEEYPSSMIEPTQLENKIKREISSKIEITDTDVEFIRLEYQEEYKKRVPIKFEGNITFLPGYSFKDSIKLEPDSVTVYGPISLVQDLKNWKTTQFEIVDCKNSVREELPLELAEQGQIILSPPKVILDFEVEEFTQKTVYVPIAVKNATDSVRLSINNVKVDFVVGISRFSKITKEDFGFEVDFKNIFSKDDNNVIPLFPTQIPDGLNAVNYFPKSVEFFIVQDGIDSTEVNPSKNTSPK